MLKQFSKLHLTNRYFTSILLSHSLNNKHTIGRDYKADLFNLVTFGHNLLVWKERKKQTTVVIESLTALRMNKRSNKWTNEHKKERKNKLGQICAKVRTSSGTLCKTRLPRAVQQPISVTFIMSYIGLLFHSGHLPFWPSSILAAFHFARLPFW